MNGPHAVSYAHLSSHRVWRSGGPSEDRHWHTVVQVAVSLLVNLENQLRIRLYVWLHRHNDPNLRVVRVSTDVRLRLPRRLVSYH
jgi:hypothetical protein